jgi:hypothetical protein
MVGSSFIPILENKQEPWGWVQWETFAPEIK